MNPNTPPDPQSVFNDWTQIQNDPRFQQLAPDRQTKLRHFFWRDQVLGNPGIAQAFQAAPQMSVNLSKAFFSGEQQTLEAEVAKAHESWYNQPLSRLLTGGAVDADKMDPGVLKGVAKFAEGMTTPLNVGLTVGTAGLGGLAGALGASVRSVRVMQGLVGAGFTADMLHGAYQQVPEFRQVLSLADQAEKAGDTKALNYYTSLSHQMMTQFALTVGTAAVVGRHAKGELRSGITNSPMPGEITNLQRLGYSADEAARFGVNDAVRAAEGGFRRPTASVTNSGIETQPDQTAPQSNVQSRAQTRPPKPRQMTNAAPIESQLNQRFTGMSVGLNGDEHRIVGFEKGGVRVQNVGTGAEQLTPFDTLQPWKAGAPTPPAPTPMPVSPETDLDEATRRAVPQVAPPPEIGVNQVPVEKRASTQIIQAANEQAAERIANRTEIKQAIESPAPATTPVIDSPPPAKVDLPAAEWAQRRGESAPNETVTPKLDKTTPEPGSPEILEPAKTPVAEDRMTGSQRASKALTEMFSAQRERAQLEHGFRIKRYSGEEAESHYNRIQELKSRERASFRTWAQYASPDDAYRFAQNLVPEIDKHFDRASQLASAVVEGIKSNQPLDRAGLQKVLGKRVPKIDPEAKISIEEARARGDKQTVAFETKKAVLGSVAKEVKTLLDRGSELRDMMTQAMNAKGIKQVRIRIPDVPKIPLSLESEVTSARVEAKPAAAAPVAATSPKVGDVLPTKKKAPNLDKLQAEVDAYKGALSREKNPQQRAVLQEFISKRETQLEQLRTSPQPAAPTPAESPSPVKPPAPIQAPPANKPAPMQTSDLHAVLTKAMQRLQSGAGLAPDIARDIEGVVKEISGQDISLSGSLAHQIDQIKALLPAPTRAKARPKAETFKPAGPLPRPEFSEQHVVTYEDLVTGDTSSAKSAKSPSTPVPQPKVEQPVSQTHPQEVARPSKAFSREELEEAGQFGILPDIAKKMGIDNTGSDAQLIERIVAAQGGEGTPTPKATPIPSAPKVVAPQVTADRAAIMAEQAPTSVEKIPGVPDLVKDRVAEELGKLGLPFGTRMEARAKAFDMYRRLQKSGDPLAFAKTIAAIKGDHAPEMPRKAYNDAFEKHAEDVERRLGARAEDAVRNVGLSNIEFRGIASGLVWFHDSVTGSTGAMEITKAKSPEAVRTHINTWLAQFDKNAPEMAKLRALPDSIRAVVEKFPAPLRAAVTMSPERAIRVVAEHTDPILRNAVADIGYDLIGTPGRYLPGAMGKTFYRSKTIGLQASGFLERTYNSIVGQMTMNDVLAHELGHGIFRKLGLASIPRLEKLYPDASADITRRYDRVGQPLIPGTPKANNEIFANAFMHWYKGLPGNDIAFERILRKNPEIWQTLQPLKGAGAEFRPGESPRIADLSYAHLANEPNDGLPLTNPIRALSGAVMQRNVNSAIRNVTAGMFREHLGAMYRSKDQLYENLAADLKRHKMDGPQQLAAFSDAMETGNYSTLSPEDQVVAQSLRQLLDERRDAIHSINPSKFEHFIENYFPHMWTDPVKGKSLIQRILASRKPLSGPSSFLKPRSIDLLSEGLQQGLEPITNSPIEMGLLRIHEMDKYIMAHRVLADLKQEGIASFIRPTKAGSRAIPQGWVRLDDRIFNPTYRNAQGELVQAGAYYAPEPAANVIHNYLAPGLRGNKVYDLLRAYGNTLNQAQLGMSAFHLGFEMIEGSMSDVALGLQKFVNHRDISGGLKVMGRGFLPFASFIHAYRVGDLMRQEYLEPGTQSQTNGLKRMVDSILTDSHYLDPSNLSRVVDAYTKADGRFTLDPYYKNSSIQKFWKDVSDNSYLKASWHGFGAFMEWTSKPVMEHVVPRVKAGVFAEMARYTLDDLSRQGITDRHSVLRALDKAADSVDNRLGQMVYDNLFWSRTAKDLGMLSQRSLGWNLGTGRELGGGVFDAGQQLTRLAKGQHAELTHRMAYTISLPIVAGFVGAMYGYLTGNPPQQLVDYYFPRTGKLDSGGKPERVSLPTYMRDVFAASSHLGETLSHKLHPMFAQMYEMWHNEDFYGTEIYHEQDSTPQKMLDMTKYLGKNSMPFSIQNYLERRRANAPIAESASSLIGVTPAPKYIGQSRAEEVAFSYAKRSMSQGPRTREVAQHHQEIAQLRNQFTMGKIGSAELSAAVRLGRITPNDLDTIVEESQQTPLERHFSHLSPSEALDVWGVATPTERATLRPMMLDKLDTIPNQLPEAQGELFKKFQIALQQ